MRLFRSIWLTASVLFLVVHQLVPHDHEQHSKTEHFCAGEQTETWSKIVGGLSLDLGQHHLELFHTPQEVHFTAFNFEGKAAGNKQSHSHSMTLFAVGVLPELNLVHPPNMRVWMSESIVSPRKAIAFSRAVRAPPVA